MRPIISSCRVKSPSRAKSPSRKVLGPACAIGVAGRYSTSQSRIVGLFGPVLGAAGLPSGPTADACLGSPTPGSEVAAAGGRSRPPLRPQPARASAASRAPTTAILARALLDD